MAGVAAACLLGFAAASGQTIAREQSSPVVQAGTHVLVVDPSGARVGRAQVQVFPANPAADVALLTMRTDRSGELVLTLPPGAYQLVVTAPGFVDAQQALEIGRATQPGIVLRLRVAVKSETLDVSSAGAGVSEGQATVWRGDQLRVLADDPATLQQQINALVPTDDGSAPELRVDGFSNGRLPPKSAIREIRINQNAFSAQVDQRGNSVVDIFTRPGGSKLQGSVYLSGNADGLNARNPYLPTAPSYHAILLDANLNGPLGKQTSFFVGTTINDLQNQAAVNAQVLDSKLDIVPYAQTVADPLLTKSGNLRLDHQFGAKNTLTARADWSSTHQENDGIGTGQLVLPSAAFTSGTEAFTLQLGNTTVASPRVVLESRFQYRRVRMFETPVSNEPSLVVQGGFVGGGSAVQAVRDAQDNYEWQEYLSLDLGKHFLRTGVRYRLTRDANASDANFNGQYTFASLLAYQATLRGLAAGQSPAQIRAAGGGASQYRVTTGTPAAVIRTGDLGAYLEDEWRVSPAFSLMGGVRFESQFGIPDHSDPAPRLGFAWSVGRHGKSTPIVRLRGGVGLFYDRFAPANILTAARENGVLQRAYYLQNPDTYPAVPAAAALSGQVPTVYQIAPGYRSPYVVSEGITADRPLWRGGLSVAFTYEHGVHQALSRNANAPLNGVRPLGGTQNLYQFSSLGWSNTTTFAPRYYFSVGRRVNFWLTYTLRFRDMAGTGATNFVSDSYDIGADYGRTQYVTRHRVTVASTYDLPFGFSATAYFTSHSAERFNITTGQDNNGDSIFNDRPAFATDLSRPSVVRTGIGNFDTVPVAGQPLVPIEYGVAPRFASLSGQVAREFVFGPRVKTEPGAPGSKPQPPDRFFHCALGVRGQNVLNHTNRSTPIGQLSSPYFGQSLSLNAEETGTTAANRVVDLWLSFRF